MSTKIIAYYLPQYHEVPENNDWWGKGFTEWVHVKNAKPLFENHIQPKFPINDNFYNLLDKRTVKWQTEISQEYGIYGFAYYHYWFNGKLLLEKPAENLLRWREINQNYFFFWANHSWYKAQNGKKRLLIEQTDGGAEDWKNHYHYLRNHFLDERYIKIRNQPVIGIYNAKDIPDIDSMIQLWNDLARNDGFSGVYVMESLNNRRDSKCSKKASALVVRQPLVALNQYNLKLYKRIGRKIKKVIKPVPQKPEMIDYNIIAKLEREYRTKSKGKEFFGLSAGWDNTPRHGNYGQVLVNQSVEVFEETLRYLLKRSNDKENEFLFINAWNEWAEGMYLEPDTVNGFAYLEAIKNVVLEGDD